LSTYGNWNPQTPNYFWKNGLLISLLAKKFESQKSCLQHIKTYCQLSYNGDGNRQGGKMMYICWHGIGQDEIGWTWTKSNSHYSKQLGMERFWHKT
jgi:hypothetical protein